jgi:hypothetical protein
VVLRILLLVHRYLAVAVGLLMALWCLSGFVMMYQPYPRLTTEERLAGLAPLDLTRCCSTAFLGDDEPVDSFSIEILGEDRLVLRRPGAAPVDLATGEPVEAFSVAELQRIAALHAAARGIDGTPRWLGKVGIDQWTIQSARANAPVHHFAFDDEAGTELYLNGRSGEVFQDTTRRERVLSWFGAIPHWLYPTVLRRHASVWAQVVIWTAVIGTFLAATGLYVGIARLGRDRNGRPASPFRGWWFWHHMAGLAFGVLVLTWVASGLLTMNPWGWLVGSRDGELARHELMGIPRGAELRSFLAIAPSVLEGGEYRRLRATAFGGRLRVIAERADGGRVMLDADGRAGALDETQVRAALARLDVPLRSLTLLTAADAYYYGHKQSVPLPVWRAVLDDAGHTRLYIDPQDASIRVVDTARRRARWWMNGLHSLDFPGLRWRPVWDVLTLLLLAGATAVSITGAWMAIQRVRRDLWRR